MYIQLLSMHSIVMHERCSSNMAASLEFSYTYKGKEYLFVEETKKNLEDLQCPVCFEIVLEPVQTSCGHLFCKECVEGVTRCPSCCEQFTSVPGHFNNRWVRSLRVKCSFAANGCKWVGDLGDVGEHEAVRFEFQPKLCPYCDFATIQKKKFWIIWWYVIVAPFNAQMGVGLHPHARIWTSTWKNARHSSFAVNSQSCMETIHSQGQRT